MARSGAERQWVYVPPPPLAARLVEYEPPYVPLARAAVVTPRVVNVVEAAEDVQVSRKALTESV